MNQTRASASLPSAAQDPPAALLPDHVSHNIEAIKTLHMRADETLSRYQRPIETVSSLLGRPAFFYGIVFFVTGWVLLNVFSPLVAVAPFDPAPYFWLQGLVGLGALLTTVIVLITQTRQGKLAEQRAQLDLQVSLLAEQKIAKLIALIEELASPEKWRNFGRQAVSHLTRITCESNQKTKGYCWPTPKCRNWCVQHAFVEGKKVAKTSLRKSTPRTLKGVDQQYPKVK